MDALWASLEITAIGLAYAVMLGFVPTILWFNYVPGLTKIAQTIAFVLAALLYTRMCHLAPAHYEHAKGVFIQVILIVAYMFAMQFITWRHERLGTT